MCLVLVLQMLTSYHESSSILEVSEQALGTWPTTTHLRTATACLGSGQSSYLISTGSLLSYHRGPCTEKNWWALWVKLVFQISTACAYTVQNKHNELLQHWSACSAVLQTCQC